MVCKKCGMEAMIMSKSSIGFEGDTSPDDETKCYRVLTYGCRNPNCSEYEKKIEEKKIYLD